MQKHSIWLVSYLQPFLLSIWLGMSKSGKSEMVFIDIE